MDVERLLMTSCFLIDLDGTIYLGEQLISGAHRFLKLLQQRGVRYLFLTNNSSRHRREYGTKLRRLGLGISDEEVFTSGEATANYLVKTHLGAKIHVVGTQALMDEFEEHGFQMVEDAPDVVVLGFDTTFTYNKLWRFCDLVRTGVPYIATHPDLNCPLKDGYMPDIGATIAFVEASTGRLPDVIVGKPNQTIVDAIELKTGFTASELCMVGDRLYTDIALGQHGLTTVLVLSGETGLQDLEDSEFQPDFTVENLEELASFLEKSPK